MTVGVDHRRRTSRLLKRLLPLLLLLAIAHNASAQSTEDQNYFDFSLPGARSRAIGGAFVAVADDATSVYSNPAGLTQLFRPEVSIEGRVWFATSRAVNSGHAFGSATGIGIDNIDGPVDRDFESDFAGLSFVSLVYPGNGWAVGVFRHQLAKLPDGPRDHRLLFRLPRRLPRRRRRKQVGGAVLRAAVRGPWRRSRVPETAVLLARHLEHRVIVRLQLHRHPVGRCVAAVLHLLSRRYQQSVQRPRPAVVPGAAVHRAWQYRGDLDADRR